MVFVFLIILFSFSGTAYAQSQNHLDEDASKFGQVLTELKVSADQLSKGNTLLSGRNNELKGHLNQLQIRMQMLLDEHNDLVKASDKLQAENPSLARKIARMENEADELNNKINGLTAQQQSDGETIKRSQEEAQSFAKKLLELRADQPAPPVAEAQPDPEKEKLRLLKMIDDSKEKQAYLYRQMANVQQNLPMSAIVSIQVPKDKDSLINQSRQLQEEVDQLSKMASQPPPADVDDSQLRQLQIQMESLQKNHDELEDLVGRMRQKIQKTNLTKDQRNEESRLKLSLSDLNNEARKLKLDLYDLRRQMVSLDKRKTTLDYQIHN